jgi:hypothetical protein
MNEYIINIIGYNCFFGLFKQFKRKILTAESYLFLIIPSFCAFPLSGQTGKSDSGKKQEYFKVATERSAKITAQLNLTDSTKFQRVQNCISSFYIALNTHHTLRDGRVRELKEKKTGSDLKQRTERIKAQTDRKIRATHKRFLKYLNADLDSLQIEKVKDGLTYGVLPATFNGYQEMIPALTAIQKGKIYEWLVEAREHAMDGGTSEEKHAWFGKYKGRINNYLSSEGYDLKKAGEEWEKRIREGKK